MKKTLLTIAAAALLVVVTVCATLAYLTSQTGEVVNTFTAGNIAITLDEADTDVYGVEIEDADRVQGNEYKLVPGHSYTKDPTIHVAAGSEKSYIFAEVTNEIAATLYESEGVVFGSADSNWVKIGDTNVYYYKNVVDASEAAQDVVVFSSFTYAANGDAAADASGKITIKGYAVQVDGFATAEAAWANTFGKKA